MELVSREVPAGLVTGDLLSIIRSNIDKRSPCLRLRAGAPAPATGSGDRAGAGRRSRSPVAGQSAAGNEPRRYLYPL